MTTDVKKMLAARQQWQRADSLRLYPAYRENFEDAITALETLAYLGWDERDDIITAHRESIKPNSHLRYGTIEDTKPVADMLGNLLERIVTDEKEVAKTETKRYRATFENGCYSEWDELPDGKIVGVVHDVSFLDTALTMPEEVGTTYAASREAWLKNGKEMGADVPTIEEAPKL